MLNKTPTNNIKRTDDDSKEDYPASRENARRFTLTKLLAPDRKVYIAHVGWYAEYFKRSPLQLGLPEARRYLVYLRDEKKVSLAHFRQAVGALRFFYKYTAGKEWSKERLSYPKLSKNIPVVMTKEGVACFFTAVTDLREKTILFSVVWSRIAIDGGAHACAIGH